jgi:hypothetical protein
MSRHPTTSRHPSETSYISMSNARHGHFAKLAVIFVMPIAHIGSHGSYANLRRAPFFSYMSERLQRLSHQLHLKTPPLQAAVTLGP